MNEPNITPSTDTYKQVAANPLRCITGSIISGGLSFAIYSLMITIATNFAKKPIHSQNPIVWKISSAVRTLIVGVVGLGTGIFGLVALGLLALGIQLWFQQLTKTKNS
jgi:hypothetical protein